MFLFVRPLPAGFGGTQRSTFCPLPQANLSGVEEGEEGDDTSMGDQDKTVVESEQVRTGG